MQDISKIDSNFAVQTSLDIDNIRFYDVREEPFSIYGVFYEDGRYRRMPQEVAEQVSEKVERLHVHTAGGRVKFVTDSSYVAIRTEMSPIYRAYHFALTGSTSFDMYVGSPAEYHGTFKLPLDITDGYENVLRFKEKALREITIHFPLYSGVTALYVGLEEDAVVQRSAGYRPIKPIVYYGSSITQGGCASRPGNAYENVLSRALEVDHINLGFAGSAKAEDTIARYIASLDMSVFVYDYDHNATKVEDLEKTHQRMFQIIRQARPDLPILILSRPKYRLSEKETARLEIIRRTYEEALAANDKNVYLIDGPTLMELAECDGTVDGIHPNDLGFHSMAKAILPQLKAIIDTL